MADQKPGGSSEDGVVILLVCGKSLELWVSRKAEGSLGYGNVRFLFVGPEIKQSRVGSWLCDLGQVHNLFIWFSFQKWRY